MTFLDALIQSLTRAAEYNRNDQVAPAVILWPDKDRQWEPLMHKLRGRMPHLLTHGPFDATAQTGPAIWLRCMIARTLPDTKWPEKDVPIVYLPGVSRQEFRSIEECPKGLLPLMELQFRSAFWTQASHKDWTVLAFMQSQDGGLGLDVARDDATLEAMRLALLKLADTDVKDLEGGRLEAPDFHELMSPDAVREILAWLNDPKGVQAKMLENDWAGFCQRCQDKFGFHPTKHGPLRGAQLLGARQGNWSKVWNRFKEAPGRYPHVPEWLRKAKPAEEDDLFLKESDEVWPQSNEVQETALRTALAGCGNKPAQQTTEQMKALESAHAKRREWIWAELGNAPLACALKHLHTLACVCGKPLGAGSVDDLAGAYSKDGWRADAAVLDALAVVDRQEDVQAVFGAIRSIYLPWLAESAKNFQKLVGQDISKVQAAIPGSVAEIKNGCIFLFADGLRFDVAQKLKEKLASAGLEVALKWRWAALPSVTPTAKPAASPVAAFISGDETGEEFRPQVKESGKSLSIDRFRQLLEENGFQVLDEKTNGQPDGRAWTEFGSLDSTGHRDGWKLAKRIGEEVKGLAERIQTLLGVGWKEVKVVTDHGWLFVPEGFPKVDLPKFLTDTRWGRCALIREGATVDFLSVPWHWAKDVRIAVAPGVCSFKAGLEYTHGGLSLQECLVPEFVVRSSATEKADVTILSLKWVGLRCRIQTSVRTPGIAADLRTESGDKISAVVAKEVEVDGQVSLLVTDDRLQGKKATVVLLDSEGTVVAKMDTTIGE